MPRSRRWRRIAGIAAGLATVPLLAASTLRRANAPVASEPERERTYWIDSVPELPRLPTLDENIAVDLAVVGGGFTGLAIAYYVKQLDPSKRVAILEAQRVGSGASTRNSGGAPMFIRGHGVSEESMRGFYLLRSFCQEHGLDVDLQESVPALTLHRSGKTCPEPVLTGDDLKQQVGSPFYEAASSAISNRLHPGKLIAGLVEANRQLGVELYEHSPVTRVDRGNPPWLHTPQARVIARDVAVATNGYTPSLGIAADRMLAVHHRVIVTRPLTDAEWEISGLDRWPFRLEHGSYFTHTVRTSPDRRFFFRHVLGHRAFEHPHWEIRAADVEAGQRELLRRYPWLEGVPIEYEWHGITGRTRDFWPIAGQVDEHLYVAAAYNGAGVTSSHYFGHLLAHKILGKEHQDLWMLRPPEEHPRIPGEFARHIGFQGWVKVARLLDGRI
jgi:gamma-glutamylputrescine oxidase